MRIQGERLAHGGEHGYETCVVFLDGGTAGEDTSLGGEPVADFHDGSVGIGAVGVDVLAGDVGDEVAVTVRFAVEDQQGFAALGGRAVALASEEQSEFERHVEAGQVDYGV